VSQSEQHIQSYSFNSINMSTPTPKEVEALSDRQLRQFRSVFTSFDKGGSGFISRFDVGQSMRTLGMHPTEGELKKMIDEMCGQGATKIDFLQFAGIIGRSLAAIRNVPSLVRAFTAFDPLGQGFVTSQQFREIFETVGEIPIPPETVDDMLVMADPSETGQVYYEPFVTNIFAQFKAAKDAKDAAKAK
jgi:calmodulin